MKRKNTIKCKVCGGGIVIGEYATECMKCGASLHPDTGEPFIIDDKVVKVSSFISVIGR